MDTLLQLDQDILLFVNGNWTPFLDYFMHLVSKASVWIPLYLCIIFVRWKTVKFSTAFWTFALAVALTFFLTDFCCSQLIRPIFNRLRPVSVENPLHELVRAVEGYRHGSCGFPSCHASNTMGLATLVWLMFRNRWTSLFMFSWSLANGYSRMYLAVHYPGDVLVGTIFGFLTGCAVYFLFEKVLYRRLQQLANRHASRHINEYGVHLRVDCSSAKLIPLVGLMLFAIMAIWSL